MLQEVKKKRKISVRPVQKMECRFCRDLTMCVPCDDSLNKHRHILVGNNFCDVLLIIERKVQKGKVTLCGFKSRFPPK